MVSVLNPTGFLYLDILYYCLILFLGPGLFWLLLIFLPKKFELHDAYLQSGVECIGIITHRQVTVRRTSVTRIETSRTYKIRYAYKAPGSDTIYIKDFVTVQKQELERRLVVVVVLPGQPKSGVAKFLLSESRPSIFVKIALYLLSIGLILFSIYVFALLFALAFNCTNDICYITPVSFVLSAVTIMSIGLFFAWVVHLSERESVPGSVWRERHHVAGTRVGTGENTQTTATPRALYENLNDRPVPMAEAVTVLNTDEETLARAAADAGVAIAHPVHTAHHPEPKESEYHDENMNIPMASAIEIV